MRSFYTQKQIINLSIQKSLSHLSFQSLRNPQFLRHYGHKYDRPGYAESWPARSSYDRKNRVSMEYDPVKRTIAPTRVPVEGRKQDFEERDGQRTYVDEGERIYKNARKAWPEGGSETTRDIDRRVEEKAGSAGEMVQRPNRLGYAKSRAVSMVYDPLKGTIVPTRAPVAGRKQDFEERDGQRTYVDEGERIYKNVRKAEIDRTVEERAGSAEEMVQRPNRPGYAESRVVSMVYNPAKRTIVPTRVPIEGRKQDSEVPDGQKTYVDEGERIYKNVKKARREGGLETRREFDRRVEERPSSWVCPSCGVKLQNQWGPCWKCRNSGTMLRGLGNEGGGIRDKANRHGVSGRGLNIAVGGDRSNWKNYRNQGVIHGGRDKGLSNDKIELRVSEKAVCSSLPKQESNSNSGGETQMGRWSSSNVVCDLNIDKPSESINTRENSVWNKSSEPEVSESAVCSSLPKQESGLTSGGKMQMGVWSSGNAISDLDRDKPSESVKTSEFSVVNNSSGLEVSENAACSSLPKQESDLTSGGETEMAMRSSGKVVSDLNRDKPSESVKTSEFSVVNNSSWSEVSENAMFSSLPKHESDLTSGGKTQMRMWNFGNVASDLNRDKPIESVKTSEFSVGNKSSEPKVFENAACSSVPKQESDLTSEGETQNVMWTSGDVISDLNNDKMSESFKTIEHSVGHKSSGLEVSENAVHSSLPKPVGDVHPMPLSMKQELGYASEEETQKRLSMSSNRINDLDRDEACGSVMQANLVGGSAKDSNYDVGIKDPSVHRAATIVENEGLTHGLGKRLTEDVSGNKASGLEILENAVPSSLPEQVGEVLPLPMTLKQDLESTSRTGMQMDLSSSGIGINGPDRDESLVGGSVNRLKCDKGVEDFSGERVIGTKENETSTHVSGEGFASEDVVGNETSWLKVSENTRQSRFPMWESMVHPLQFSMKHETGSVSEEKTQVGLTSSSDVINGLDRDESLAGGSANRLKCNKEGDDFPGERVIGTNENETSTHGSGKGTASEEPVANETSWLKVSENIRQSWLPMQEDMVHPFQFSMKHETGSASEEKTQMGLASSSEGINGLYRDENLMGGLVTGLKCNKGGEDFSGERVVGTADNESSTHVSGKGFASEEINDLDRDSTKGSVKKAKLLCRRSANSSDFAKWAKDSSKVVENGFGQGFCISDVVTKRKKGKSVWVCVNCGHAEVKWWGECKACESVGTLKQFSLGDNGGSGDEISGSEVSGNTGQSWLRRRTDKVLPMRLTDVNRGINKQEWRIPLPGSFGSEVARVLGGGVVPGSLVLVGGDPGVGKSTLLLQVAALISQGHGTREPGPVVYVSGEESVEQIGNRADRMQIGTKELFLYSSTDVEDVLEKSDLLSPQLLIVDSIQTAYLRSTTGSAGGVTQVRECTSALLRYAKRTNVPVLLIGHVTKTGDIAGPRVLEHIVDVVLYLEGEKHTSHRLLRSVKNRFGSTDELGVFEMSQAGLQAVSNPSAMFLTEQHLDSEVLAGLAVAAVMDGTRTFLVEIQALCVSGLKGSRHFNGVQSNRADLIISVLAKQAGLKLQENDICLNVVSGMRLPETAGDLAIAAAICSSFLEFPIPSGIAFIGEIGLSGELRSVPRMDVRVNSLAQLGYSKCIVPKSVVKSLKDLDRKNMEIIGCSNLKHVINTVFTNA